MTIPTEALAAMIGRAKKTTPGPWKIYAANKDGSIRFDSESGAIVGHAHIQMEGKRILLYQGADADFIVHAKEDLLAVIVELEEMKAKYQGEKLRCNAGHENHLPLALWDCPMCGAERLQKIQDLEATNARLITEAAAMKASFHKQVQQEVLDILNKKAQDRVDPMGEGFPKA